jgi:N,N'-diacetyllegionaminate synthase
MIEHVKIIAEAGVNHNGSIDLAKKLIDIAAKAGADFVKFQTFKADNLVTEYADKANYQKKLSGSDESQFEMIKRLELNISDHQELIRHCKKNEIQFLSTGFDVESIDLLSSLEVPFFKIPSGEITNLPYLRHIAKKRKPVVLSTGMSTIGEIKNAMRVFFDEGLEKEQITVLHCNSEYPTPMEDVNLNAMITIRDEFNVKVGFSDHTQGIEVAIAAVAMGASIIEKHFTIDRALSGPDHMSSLNPNELEAMVKKIRNIQKCLGNGIKKPSNSEIKNIDVARKSIVAFKEIEKGELFVPENITTKRPGDGISPMNWDYVIGKKAFKNFKKNEKIELKQKANES